MSFADLKRSSSQTFEQLNAELSKLNQKRDNSAEDDNYWKPTIDKAGNGYAVIRFLPAPEGETVPFVRVWDHGFEGPGGWYIELSLTTIGKEDPLAELNGRLWKSGLDSDKEIARKQKRRLSYHSNIYVVSDPANPSAEGKVWKYKYGKKIFDKINDAMNPAFEDEKPINPFDLWTGANFKLKIRNVEGWTNYDKSEFDSQGPLFNDDDKMEEIWKQEHKLQPLIDPSRFKSYEVLKARLDKVLGTSGKNLLNEEDRKTAEAAPIREAAPRQEPATSSSSDDDDDDFMKLFNTLED